MKPYLWRRLTSDQRQWVLSQRQVRHHPWHSPPHRYDEGKQHYHITAACFEHCPHIGHTEERMEAFTEALLEVFQSSATELAAWCVLPNHYHALIQAPIIAKVLFELGRLHGRCSHAWNQEESTTGRQNFHSAVDRTIRSDRHYMATLNYIRHNPVRHGYASKWTDWPWSSAHAFIERVGREEAEVIWKEFPVLEYGEGWDDAAL